MNNNKKFQIICPAGKPTGGVELLHQMAYILKNDGYSVHITYWPLKQEHTLNIFYKEYLNGVSVLDRIIDEPETIIILPEVFSYFIHKIKRSKIVFWWLSVDNYINSKKLGFAYSNRFFPFTYWNVQKNDRILHAVQSEYAKIYLSKYQVETNFYISDYINDEYFDEYAQNMNLNAKSRKDVLVYNPAKGGEEQKKLISFLEKNIQCIPLKNMDKKTMIRILGESKVYIDFGEHPGKDRIPRESATLGCCIITNKKGSAENDVDIPIPESYKFVQVGGYILEVEKKVLEIFENFEEHTKDFDAYRNKIKAEKDLFVEQVKKFAKDV